MTSTIGKAIAIAKNEGLYILMRKSLRYIKYKFDSRFYWLYRFTVPYAVYRIKHSKFNNLNEIVDFSFNSLFELIRPIQVREEISELLNLLSKRRPNVVLEIGTANGGTLFLFSRIASENATIVSVDLPEGMFGGGYPNWKIPLYKSFAFKNQKIYLIQGDSHSIETLKEVKNIIGENKVDFLFIDGDHTYEGVKKDFEMYSPLVKAGGIICFHDIVPGPEVNVGGVPKFWSEIKFKYRHKEIVKSWDQGGYGIGVLFIDQ